MRIGFLAPINGITGGLYVAYYHAHYLAARGHQVEVIFVSHELGTTVECFPNFSLKTTTLRESAISSEKYDVLIATWWETYYQMFHLRSNHYLYLCQSDERKFYSSSLSYQVPFVDLTYRDQKVGLIVVAKWLQDWLSAEFKVDAKYAPNGIDLNRFNPNVKPLVEKSNRVRVLIEGPGSVEFKRLDLAFRVVNRLSNIEVWLVSGDGVVKPHWKYDRVFKQVPMEQMPAIYRSCDILLKLSAIESFGYPPLEMLACGGTAVVTKTPGHDEYLIHEKNSLLVEIDDEEGAERALRRLVEDQKLRQMLSEEGVRTVQTMRWEDRSPIFERALLEYVESTSAPDLQIYYRMLDHLKSAMGANDALEKRVLKIEKWPPFKIWNLTKDGLKWIFRPLYNRMRKLQFSVKN